MAALSGKTAALPQTGDLRGSNVVWLTSYHEKVIDLY
jgi:hypothetical protein